MPDPKTPTNADLDKVGRAAFDPHTTAPVSDLPDELLEVDMCTAEAFGNHDRARELREEYQRRERAAHELVERAKARAAAKTTTARETFTPGAGMSTPPRPGGTRTYTIVKEVRK